MNEVLSISPSANVFGFGGFDVNHMDWLTYSSGTDRSGRLRFNFPISNDLTQMINFPPRMPDSDSQGPTVSFISSDTIIFSTATFPSLGNSDHVVVQFPWITFEFSFWLFPYWSEWSRDYSHADRDGLVIIPMLIGIVSWLFPYWSGCCCDYSHTDRDGLVIIPILIGMLPWLFPCWSGWPRDYSHTDRDGLVIIPLLIEMVSWLFPWWSGWSRDPLNHKVSISSVLLRLLLLNFVIGFKLELIIYTIS